MTKRELLSSLPKVDEVLKDESIGELLSEIPRELITDSIRYIIDIKRREILGSEDLNEVKINESQMIGEILRHIKKSEKLNLSRVINCTGVVLHTNLGRALLADEAVEAMIEVAKGYSTLEYDIRAGKRGSRYSHIEEIVCKLTGAESALVVNNNAAAVMLVLNTMTDNKEVVVSRGQLVEIGGSFRVPDVMEQSGATLVEVGTTNKTHPRDYENAITEDTGALLKVHTSNYKILGFTKEVGVDELVEISKTSNIPVIEDIGSGSLISMATFGLTHEPTVGESIKAGVDVVTFSGDKLLGGPQAGIIVGKKVYIDAMKKNQLTRALRVDKLTLSALEATLRLYLDKERAIEKIPTLKMLSLSKDEILDTCNYIEDKLKSAGIQDVVTSDGKSQVGGGALPLDFLDTVLVNIKLDNMKPVDIEKRLRDLEIPIIVRIKDDSIILDPRTIRPGEEDIVVEGILDVWKKG